MNTYAFEHPFLGDTWAACQWLLHHSARIDQPVGLHRFVGHHDISEQAAQCLEEIAAPAEAEVVITDEPGEVVPYLDLFQTPYFPTKTRWYPQKSGVVCYQLDGRSGRADKNIPTPELEQLLIRYIEAKGYRPVQVGGGKMSISQIVTTLASSEAFVGVESGVSHLAHSVGTPTFILQNALPLDHLLYFHTGKAFTLCADVPDFMAKFGVWHKSKPAAFVIQQGARRKMQPVTAGCTGCGRRRAQSQIETGAADVISGR